MGPCLRTLGAPGAYGLTAARLALLLSKLQPRRAGAGRVALSGWPGEQQPPGHCRTYRGSSRQRHRPRPSWHKRLARLRQVTHAARSGCAALAGLGWWAWHAWRQPLRPVLALPGLRQEPGLDPQAVRPVQAVRRHRPPCPGRCPPVPQGPGPQAPQVSPKRARQPTADRRRGGDVTSPGPISTEPLPQRAASRSLPP